MIEMVFPGLATLWPGLLNKLLQACKSVNVKRLSLVSIAARTDGWRVSRAAARWRWNGDNRLRVRAYGAEVKIKVSHALPARWPAMAPPDRT